MTDKHKQRVLFDAVTGIDEDLIDEAAAPRMLAFPRRVLRVASIAAILALLLTWLLWPGEIKTDEDGNIISAPGMLVVRAYALDENTNTPIEEVILEEGVEFAPYVHYHQGMSRAQWITFDFYLDESAYHNMNITIELETDAGIFSSKTKFAYLFDEKIPGILEILLSHDGQHFTTDNSARVWWEPYGFDYDHLKTEIDKACLTPFGYDYDRLEEAIETGRFDKNYAYKSLDFENSPSFIDVIIRADEHIVGYGVIEIRDLNDYTGRPYAHDWHFSFTMLTMVSFPQVDGQWQSVTKEYVTQQIQQIHENAKSVGGDSE